MTRVVKDDVDTRACGVKIAEVVSKGEKTVVTYIVALALVDGIFARGVLGKAERDFRKLVAIFAEFAGIDAAPFVVS